MVVITFNFISSTTFESFIPYHWMHKIICLLYVSISVDIDATFILDFNLYIFASKIMNLFESIFIIFQILIRKKYIHDTILFF